MEQTVMIIPIEGGYTCMILDNREGWWEAWIRKNIESRAYLMFAMKSRDSEEVKAHVVEHAAEYIASMYG